MKRLPLELCGRVMSGVDPLLRGALRMAVEGSSSHVGRPPRWFERSVDIRFVDYSIDHGDTVLRLEAPRLGESAEELYRQQELWDTKPSADETAFDVLSRVVQEVSDQNAESSWFDRALLARFTRLGRLFTSELDGVRLEAKVPGAKLTPAVVRTAAALGASTPAARQVRVTGKLDMIRHSTRSFGLTLASGEEVHGVLAGPELMEPLRELFGRSVLVLGRAVYRPSGRLLRIDANGVEDGEGLPALWSKIPAPQSKRPNAARLRPAELGKRGVAAFFGTWPGDESDAELARAATQARG